MASHPLSAHSARVQRGRRSFGLLGHAGKYWAANLRRWIRCAWLLFAHDRFLGQVDIGGLPYAKVAKSIELLATQVLPAMRKPAPDGVDQGC
jgi:hypothetical protein